MKGKEVKLSGDYVRIVAAGAQELGTGFAPKVEVYHDVKAMRTKERNRLSALNDRVKKSTAVEGLTKLGQDKDREYEIMWTILKEELSESKYEEVLSKMQKK